MTTGRFTLPVAVFISLLCCLSTALFFFSGAGSADAYRLWDDLFHSSEWAPGIRQAVSLLLYAVAGCLLIGLNNTYALIRMRASVQTAVFYLLVAVCPVLQLVCGSGWLVICFCLAVYFLFSSYQSPLPGALFHSFLFLGAGSMLFPPLVWLSPLFWLGAWQFQSLTPRSFFASLMGWSLPFWFLLGYAYCYGQMELFVRPFAELVQFRSWCADDYPLWVLATAGYLLLLYLCSLVHCIVARCEDKLRTRSYLNFLLYLCFFLFVGMGVQPTWSIHLLALLLVCISILAGHLFVLTSSRFTNALFIVMFVLLFVLWGLNVWTVLWIH